MEVNGLRGSIFMVELHYVQCMRMKPEEAGGGGRGLPRILSGLNEAE